jgi:hypothetical protein
MHWRHRYFRFQTMSVLWMSFFSYLNEHADSEAAYLLQRGDSLHSYSAVIYEMVRHLTGRNRKELNLWLRTTGTEIILVNYSPAILSYYALDTMFLLPSTHSCISRSWNNQRRIIFRQQNRLLAILVKHHRSRRFTQTDLYCSDLLSVCLSVYPCVFLRSSLIHAQQTSHKMLYRVHEARKKFTPRSSFENQKSSTKRQYATTTFKGRRKRDLTYTRKAPPSPPWSSSSHGPTSCATDGRALTPSRERAGAGKTTALDTALDVPGRNCRLLAAILLLCNGIFHGLLDILAQEISSIAIFYVSETLLSCDN